MSEKVEDNTIQYVLQVETENSYTTIRKLEVTFMRLLTIVEKFSGGDPNIRNMINILQKSIMWVKQLQMTIHAFELAVGPIGWLYAAVSGAMLFVTTTESIADGIRTVE